MPSFSSPRFASPKIAVALLLTLAAGVIDVTGFLLFWQVFTAHMTGNTAHFAMAMVKGNWHGAAKVGAVIPIFLTGSIAGRCLIEYCGRLHWRRAASLVFVLEAAILSEIIWLNQSQSPKDVIWLSLLLLSFAMGLQTAGLTRIGPLTVHTTFVTGMLNSLAQRLATLLFWITDRIRGAKELQDVWHSRDLLETWLLTAVWCAYVAGGVLGAVSIPRWHATALLAAVVLLFIVIILDQLSPLSLEEEEDAARQEALLRKEPAKGGG